MGDAIIRTHLDNANAAAKIRELVAQGNAVYVRWSLEEIKEEEEQRTDQQRKALEVYFRNVAETLNTAGLDQRKVFAGMKEGTEIPWSQSAVKDGIWRIVQIALLDKQSTTRLSTAEVSRVYDVVNRFLIDRFSVSVPFPDRFGEK